MEKIILITQEELKGLIREVLTEYFPREQKKAQESDNITLGEAIIFLKENGYPTSKAKLYKLTASNRLPYGKYGNKLVFSKKKLLQWCSQQTIQMNDHSESLSAFRESINRKRK